MTRALLTVAILGALLAPSTAHADPAVVEDLIHQAVELRKRGADHRAMPLLRKAYDLERSARTAAQLGLVEAQLGYWLAAEKHLTEALSSTRNPWLSKHESQLRQTLQHVQGSIGAVEVKGLPAGAEVLVNGQAAGRLPLPAPVRVPEGAVQVTVRADGHAEKSSSLVVRGGQQAEVTITLEPSRDLAATARPEAAEPAVERSRASAGQDEGEPDARGGSWIRPASWAALVGGLAAAGVGAYGLSNQRARGRDFDAHTVEGSAPGTKQMPCNLRDANKGGDTCQSLYRKMKAGERMAIVGFAAGGLLLTGAVLGFILGPPSSAGPEPESAWSFLVDPGSAPTVRVDLSLRF